MHPTDAHLSSQRLSWTRCMERDRSIETFLSLKFQYFLPKSLELEQAANHVRQNLGLKSWGVLKRTWTDLFRTIAEKNPTCKFQWVMIETKWPILQKWSKFKYSLCSYDRWAPYNWPNIFVPVKILAYYTWSVRKCLNL